MGEHVRSTAAASQTAMLMAVEELLLLQEAHAHSQGVPSQGIRVDLSEEGGCVWKEARARSPAAIFFTILPMALGGASVCLEGLAPSRVVQSRETQLKAEEAHLCKAGCARSRRHASLETKL